jgi:hypothetical protein
MLLRVKSGNRTAVLLIIAGETGCPRVPGGEARVFGVVTELRDREEGSCLESVSAAIQTSHTPEHSRDQERCWSSP